MLRKNCRICGKASYSATERGSWPCPYCDNDLAKEKAMDANSSERAQADDQSFQKLLFQSESHRENN